MNDKRVLIIDDQFEMMENDLKSGLGANGFCVVGETERLKALESIKNTNPDVVLLDIFFPDGRTGKLTIKEIKKKYPDLPVIMFTSTMADDEYHSDDYTLADYCYAKKALQSPDGFSDLAFHLQNAIDKAKTDKPEDYKTEINHFGFIVGKTEAMLELSKQITKVAHSDISVLITGESGTGKELIAQFTHKKSRRRDKPFIKVNCAALPENLLESELFGHEKGAFTGANNRRKGRFELANGGSLFLDEIGELSLVLQAKLLRILEDQRFERVGGNETISVDVRIIAATNKNLKTAIEENKFRRDLYMRLNKICIAVPPLRERKEDIPSLFEHFVVKANEQYNKKVLQTLRNDIKNIFMDYEWLGNIRELSNAVERAVNIADANILQVKDFKNIGKELVQPSGHSQTIPDIVDGVREGRIKYKYIMEQTCGSMRKDVTMGIIDFGYEKYGRRPTQKDLAEILSTSQDNIAQLLKKTEIKLTALPIRKILSK